MCKYYQVGRFSELGSEEFDEGSAFYHLELAAELAVREAIFASAKIYLDLPRDLLPNFRPTVIKKIFVHLLLRKKNISIRIKPIKFKKVVNY